MIVVLEADARNIPLPDESVQCVVSSPPYWGLRDYGLRPTVWGGEDHDHEWGEMSIKTKGGIGQQKGLKGNIHIAETWDAAQSISQGRFCPCGAWLGTLGLEPTPELYVQHIVEVFREVRRVLRKDGTCWVNLGDSYAGGGVHKESHANPGLSKAGIRGAAVRVPVVSGLKPKDLCGIPWRVAFALQADGWWLRRDIIWSKPNPMPESVTDRPTTSHEYLFLLTKAERYYYDADSVREPHITKPHAAGYVSGKAYAVGPMNRNGHSQREGDQTRIWGAAGGRNLRSVWNIATQPFPESHFAVFPEKLVETCLKAGTKPNDLVMDPFSGSGTVGLVCLKMGRSYVGLELKDEYNRMAQKRIYNGGSLFA